MQNATDGGHVPVLLEESLAALAMRDDGIYVDGTFGRGGHARAILASLGARGRLVAVDRDPDAEAAARRDRATRVSFSAARGSRICRECSMRSASTRIDGALLDLGVSSPQLDDPARGFSYRFDGPLDMRMDPSRGESAAAFIARAPVARTDGGHPRLW